MTEQTFTVRPTVIVRLSEEEGTLGAVSVGAGEEEALIVFRGLEDARSYQEHTGKHTLEKGHKLVGVGIEGLTAREAWARARGYAGALDRRGHGERL